jgi:GrpB-like predicted nucleotidyltransferase (UPF0157 family)
MARGTDPDDEPVRIVAYDCSWPARFASGCIGDLAKVGYRYAPYRAEEMHWFCKPDPGHRTHHLHLVPTGSRRYQAELAFRDALRSKPDLAVDYANLKRSLASRYEHDREQYTQKKADFIQKALPLG